MKKIIKLSVIVSMVFFCQNLHAQKFNYGIQAGANFAVQSELGAIYNNNDFNTGLSIGVFSNYNLSDAFALQLEFSYDEKGSQTDDVKNNYNYISIPLLAKYTLYNEPNSSIILDCYGGPYAAFLLDAKQSYENSENEDKDLAYNTNSADFGLQYGFMAKYPLNESNLLLNLKFGLGLTSYDDINKDLRNKYVSLSLGYEF